MFIIFPMFTLWVVLLNTSTTTNAYLAKTYRRSRRISKRHLRKNGILNLTPVAQFDDQIRFLETADSYRLCIDKNGYLRDEGNDNPFYLCVVEKDDLPDISRLTVDAFGAATVTLSGELTRFERVLISPTVGLWNAYADIMAYAEVLTGLRSRLGDRLKGDTNVAPPKIADAKDRTETHEIATRSSIVLALAREKLSDKYKCIEPIATVELRLQPTDAKIPFSQPWLDDIERNTANMFGVNAATIDKDLQPYLSNLCVAESERGKKIGTAMIRCIECIAKNVWGYSKLYLHVDLENKAAVNLYKSEGYRDVGYRWRPFWAGKAAAIGYFFKDL